MKRVKAFIISRLKKFAVDSLDSPSRRGNYQPDVRKLKEKLEKEKTK